MFTGAPISSNIRHFMLEADDPFVASFALHARPKDSAYDIFDQRRPLFSGNSFTAQAAILLANGQDAPQLNDREANCHCTYETGSLVELRKQHEERRKKLGFSSPLDTPRPTAYGRYRPYRIPHNKGKGDALGMPLNRLLTILPDDSPPHIEKRTSISPTVKKTFIIRLKKPQSA